MTYDKDDFPVVLQPVWEPFGTEAEKAVDRLLKDGCWPVEGPKAIKYRVMLASFLKAVQDVHLRHSHSRNDNKEMPHLGVRWRNEAWSPYPLVGKDIAKKVIPELLRQFDAKLVEGSGSSNLVKDEEGKWATDPKMSMYVLDESLFPPNLYEAKFIQVGRLEVKVNKVETRQQKTKRNNDKKAKPFIREGKCRDLFGTSYEAAKSRIQSLNEFWRLHPIKLPDGHMAACATRVYHDGRLDAGGRIYGAWTGLKKDKRLQCKIDGEPICELDIRASQPTLFSSLLGYRLGNLMVGDTWTDVYAELSSLWATNIDWLKHDPLINPIDLIQRNRSVAKGVVVELIGNGTPLKSKATKDLAIKHGLTSNGWIAFRDRMLRTVPALQELEPRYDNKGNLSGYMNGAGFLSYHESEMMMLTLEALQEHGIPAYPVHDCLMVKVSDVKQSAYVFRDIIREYCKTLSGLEVLVPLSVESSVGGLLLTEELNMSYGDIVVGEYLN